MCAFVVLGLVFPYQAKRLAWGNVSEMIILRQVGCKNHNSIKGCSADVQGCLSWWFSWQNCPRLDRGISQAVV